MKIRRKFKGRKIKKYENGSTVQSTGLRESGCPEGFIWNAMTGECSPAANQVWDATGGGYKDSQRTDNTPYIQPNLQPADSSTPNNLEEGQVRTPEFGVRGKIQPQGGTDASYVGDYNQSLESSSTQTNEEIQQQIEFDRQRASETEANEGLVPNFQEGDNQSFNPYAGVDIPTAAYIFGESIGKDGDPLTAVASGLKVVAGLGRNITSGIGNANRNAHQLKEVREKRRESKIGLPTALGADGGTIHRDLTALYDKVQFPSMDKGGTTGIDKDKKIKTRAVTREEAEANSYKNSPDSPFTADGIMMLGFVNEEVNTETPKINYGKYKGLNYFKESRSGERVVLEPTSNNIRNAQGHKDSLKYLQELNPGIDFATGSSNGYVATGERPKMKDGGSTQGKIIAGSLVEGTNNGNENVELEDKEFLQKPGDTPKQVVGKTHEESDENGTGEKMNLPGGTDVLSDNLTLTKMQVKQLKEDYGITVNTKDTYAKALEKYNKKIGLAKLIDEEAEVIDGIKSQKESMAEQGADEATLNINLEFLSSKLKDLTDEKLELEKVSSQAFSEMFKLQEESKPKSERSGIQTEFSIGGKVYSEGQILEIATKFGVDKSKAISIVKQMEDGGNIDPGKKVTKAQAEENVAKGIWEDLGGGKYRKVGTPGIEYSITELTEEGQAGTPDTVVMKERKLGSYKNAWVNGKVDKQLYPTFDKFVEAAEEYWAKNNDKGRSKVVEEIVKGKPGTDDVFEEIKTEIEGTPDEFFFTEEAEGDSGKSVSNEEVQNENSIEGDKLVDDGKGGFSSFLLPENMPLTPQGLQMPAKQQVRFGRLDAERLSPEQRLAELNRGVDAAMSQLDKLPSGQREAAVMQLQANKQAQTDKIIQETNAGNNQISQNEDMFNIRQGDREEITNTQLTTDYEGKVFGALANTEDDFRRFFNTSQERNIQNFNTINSLNLLNQSSDNFNYGNNGVEFTGGANMSAEDYWNVNNFKNAVANSSSRSKVTKKTKTAKRGGRIKRKY